jgi:hypothetical protein
MESPMKRKGCGLVAVLVTALLCGCSSSGGKPVRPTTSSTPAGAPADAATARAVRSAYAAFFNSTSSIGRSQAALQHGRSFHDALVQQANSPLATDAAVKVTDVRRLGPDLAAVTFTITQKGVPLLAGQVGHAVRDNGHWQVAAETFCTLLTAAGGAPSACSDPKITALPH